VNRKRLVLRTSASSDYPTLRRVYIGLFKPFLDITASIILLLLSSPILIVASFLIYLEDGATPVFIQQRLGYLGAPFPMIKLRTMKNKGTARLNTKAFKGWTYQDDPRITRIGALLRKYRIDEIPQLINVLAGQMSLIGPRPETLDGHNMISRKFSAFDKRLLVKPGITGLAQVSLGYTDSIQNSGEKLKHDLTYIKDCGPSLDLSIAFRTIVVVLNGLNWN